MKWVEVRDAVNHMIAFHNKEQMSSHIAMMLRLDNLDLEIVEIPAVYTIYKTFNSLLKMQLNFTEYI